MTNLEKTIINWRREHFVLFVYVLAALSDNELMYNEWDLLKEKMSKISPADEFPVLFVDVTKLYQRITPDEVLQVISFFRGNFELTSHDIESIVKNVQEIVMIDQEVKESELEIALSIRRMLSKG